MICKFIAYVYRGKWNISVPRGKETNKNSVSSGERKQMSPNRFLFRKKLKNGVVGQERSQEEKLQIVYIDEVVGNQHQRGW